MSSETKCTCTPTDLQPFGECICGASGSREVFDNPTISAIKQSMAIHDFQKLLEENEKVIKQLQDDILIFGFCLQVKHDGRIRRIDPTSEEAQTILKYDRLE